jgi:hypothetical protein
VIDNIIVGKLVEGLTYDQLGILPTEETIQVSTVCLFLPRILVQVGLFNSTNEIKKINKQRLLSTKIKDVKSKDLWRTIVESEMTQFKVGKKFFWLFVGPLDK